MIVAVVVSVKVVVYVETTVVAVLGAAFGVQERAFGIRGSDEKVRGDADMAPWLAARIGGVPGPSLAGTVPAGMPELVGMAVTGVFVFGTVAVARS